MPFTLFPPKPGRSPFYRVRGTEFGIRLNRSTQTSDKREAQQFLAKWRQEAKQQSLAGPAKKAVATFASAALAYMRADHSPRFLAPLIRHFAETALSGIDQRAIDEAASKLYPGASAPTRNRQVYSPISAVMRHAGVIIPIRRPKGSSGTPRTGFLSTEEAFALLGAAKQAHPRFGALLTFLLYTGVRLSEALRIKWVDIDFERASALVGKTKNGQPITVNLPPVVLAELRAIHGRNSGGPERVFRLTKSGRLYGLLADAAERSGVDLPERSAFHILRHSHATWRRLYTGADTSALVQTGLWKSRNAAAVYEHLDVSAEAKKSDLLPTPQMVEVRKTCDLEKGK